MSDTISLPGLLVALLLPWLAGSLLVYRLLLASPSRNLFIVVGHGYLVGMIVSSQALRASSGLFGGLGFWPVAGLMGLVALACAWSIRLAWAKSPVPHPRGNTGGGWQTALLLLFLVLIASRLSLLAQELVLRPLYPWDGWMNWAPKAVVWFQRGELVEFLNPHDWLRAADRSAVYTLGNWRAAEYPDALPLMWLWTMLGAQTSAHPLLNLPWLLLALALASAFYGQLRLLACPRWLATLVIYLLLTIPYLNAHTVLAGYADIWLAAAFSLGVFSLHACVYTGSRAYLLLTLFFAVVCTQLKVPGFILAAIIMVFLCFYLLKLGARSQLLLLLLLVTVVFAAMAIGLQVPLAGFDDLRVSMDAIQLPLLGKVELAWHPVYQTLAETLFAMMNWNLLWYFYALALAVLLLRPGVRRPLFAGHGTVVLISVVATTVITAVFLFSSYYQQALNFTTVNRAYLYVAPLALYVVALALLADRGLGEIAPGERPHRAA